MKRFRVGIVTMEATPWELEDNFQRMEEYVREAARRRAHLVIAPEGILDGYVCGADPNVTEEGMVGIAQRIPDGPYLKRGGALANELGIYLIFGFLERDGEELLNSCALFDPDGEIIAKFSKVHTAGEAFITPGKELAPVDTPLGRVGMLICKDRSVPENFRALGVQGAEMVFLPMDGSGGPTNTEMLRQRARDNVCWIVSANTWSCAVIDPTGDVYLEKYESECVSVQRMGPGRPGQRGPESEVQTPQARPVRPHRRVAGGRPLLRRDRQPHGGGRGFRRRPAEVRPAAGTAQVASIVTQVAGRFGTSRKPMSAPLLSLALLPIPFASTLGRAGLSPEYVRLPVLNDEIYISLRRYTK